VDAGRFAADLARRAGTPRSVRVRLAFDYNRTSEAAEKRQPEVKLKR